MALSEHEKQTRRTWYSNNRERHLANGKRWREANREKQTQTSKRYRESDPRRQHGYQLSRRGVTIEQYENMLAEQGGTCALCNGVDKDRRLSVDHDHDTGKIRGLLCYPCNTSLGRFGDNLEGVYNVVRYLEDQ